MRLGAIAAVTIATADLDRSVDLYQRHLEYRLAHRGSLDDALARSWGTDALPGRDYAVLAPRGSADFRLRFVQSPAAPDYAPFRHFGWNAAEFLVQDVDALAERLQGSPFQLIGPPADLSFTDKIRAMQVLGPSGEALYLTQIKTQLPDFDTPTADARVDRVFITILGGRSVESLQDFYNTRLGVPRAPVIDAVISVMSRAYGLPPLQKHELSALPLGEACYIEADAMPAEARERPTRAGELPPAIAMVSFRCGKLPALDYLGPPASVAEEPYAGRRSAVCRGSAGELIELIES